MSWFSDIFSGTVGGVVEGIGNVADKFITTDDEKNAFRLETLKLIQQRDSEIEATARAELEAKSKILQAELQQGDNYTKRARPTTVYFGLGVIFFNYCAVPLITLIKGVPIVTFELPTEFWVAWGGIVSTWVIGRSAEKRGSENRLTKVVTGSDKLL
jgi:hypothetical protein